MNPAMQAITVARRWTNLRLEAEKRLRRAEGLIEEVVDPDCRPPLEELAGAMRAMIEAMEMVKPNA